MNRQMLSPIFPILAAAIFSLTSCGEGKENPSNEQNTESVKFEIAVSSPETRTVSDAVGKVTWASGDGLGVFHAASGSSFSSDGLFAIASSGENVLADGFLAHPLTDGTAYTWKMVYPYSTTGTLSSYPLTFGSASDGVQTQSGDDSKAHLAGANTPLYATTTSTGGATPVFTANQLASGVKITVKNTTSATVTVSKVEFTVPDSSDPIVGSFTADLSGDTPVIKANASASRTATLSTGVDIAAGSEGAFYLDFAPTTVAAGAAMTITVKTEDDATQTFTKTPTAEDLQFKAGEINYTLVEFNATAPEGDEPTTYGACPTASQVEWQRQELLMFCHFGPATFTGTTGENGAANTDVDYLNSMYNPTGLDTDNWAKVAYDNGFKEIILTAKHHDGFSLFPNEYSQCGINYVTNNTYGYADDDVLAALAASCKKYGLKMGVYMSPWDKNDKSYGVGDGSEYNQHFLSAIEKIMKDYAPVSEFWFDGYNGGSSTNNYNWDSFNEAVYKVNPNAIIFSNEGTSHSESIVKKHEANYGCRWPGNEDGAVGRTNWSTFNHHAAVQDGTNGVYHTDSYTGYLETGDEDGAYWVPSESDVVIHFKGNAWGWFWNANRTGIKTAEQLLDIYYTSVGRNSVMLLNVPPTTAGVLDEGDVAILQKFHGYIKEIFGTNYALGATVVNAQTTPWRGTKYAAENVIDEDYDTYYAVEGDDATSCTLVLKRATADMFNRISLQEYIPKGQRVKEFTVYTSADGSSWTQRATGTTIGHKRILYLGGDITDQYVKIDITSSLATPLINEVGLYYDSHSKQD